MPAQVLTSVENHFNKGLVTEFTGLNFPEDAATDSDNTEYTIVGDVIRREGIDVEINGVANVVSRANMAISTYKWNNVSGDGVTQIVVEQIGGTLYFYKSSTATETSPLSTQLLTSTVLVSAQAVSSATFDATLECTYSDGNGYLFVYHPNCDPFYCVYNAGVVTANAITVQIRDFQGDVDGLDFITRPSTLTDAHLYNLTNQGWTQGAGWAATSNTVVNASLFTTGSRPFSTSSGLSVTTGDAVTGSAVFYQFVNPFFNSIGQTGLFTGTFTGNVTSYVAGILTVNITSVYIPGFVNYVGLPISDWQSITWTITPTNHGYISTWNSQVGGYPSNSDVWWYFKNTSDVFAPSTTLANVTVNTGNAPRGHYILSAFNQQRRTVSSIASISDVSTTARPSNGAWFQGRVWYTGVNASQPATGTANNYSWTEQIYFSQIITDPSQFGYCYQTNDPTSENLFDLLPTDGGVIQIQGCGPIYKLFPLMNAMLVFAANGVWYISGGTSVGFSAVDYTVVKLSAVRSISSTSYVDINGLPIFWNEEGIYQVEPAKQGQGLLNSPLHVNPLEVNALTVGTILSFYNLIPLSSKQYCRGVYDPINYVVQWIYKDTESISVTDRYTYNKILNYNTANKAFFPYTVDTSLSSINGIVYVVGPGGLNSSVATIKYVASNGSNTYIADEHDSSFTDWTTGNGVGVNYISTFTAGYKLHGQGERRFQVPYIYVYSRLEQPVAYYIQSLWDYATNEGANRWSVNQLININSPNYGMAFRRHRLRGQGLVLQIRITSVDGMPFDIIGWAMFETQNVGV